MLLTHLNSFAFVPQFVEEQIVRQRHQSEDKIESAKAVIGAEIGSVEPIGTENEEIKEGHPSN